MEGQIFAVRGRRSANNVPAAAVLVPRTGILRGVCSKYRVSGATGALLAAANFSPWGGIGDDFRHCATQKSVWRPDCWYRSGAWARSWDPWKAGGGRCWLALDNYFSTVADASDLLAWFASPQQAVDRESETRSWITQRWRSSISTAISKVGRDLRSKTVFWEPRRLAFVISYARLDSAN